MSSKKKDISQIEKYLRGELDHKEMHQLESQTQDDPFLMDAMVGYEASGNNHIGNDIDRLKQRLADRIARRGRRMILLWKVMPIAASLLLIIGAGWWFITNRAEKRENTKVASNLNPQKSTAASTPASSNGGASPSKSVTKPAPKKALQNSIAASKALPKPALNPNQTTKQDTVLYKAAPYTAKQNADKKTLDELLKKMESRETDSLARLAYNAGPVTKARLNGKEFLGGSVQQASKNLPAELIEKIQIVNDYGDQGSKKDSALKKSLADLHEVAIKPVLKARQQTAVFGRATTPSIGGQKPAVQFKPDTALISQSLIRGYVKKNRDQIAQPPLRIGNNEVQDNPVGNVDQLLQGKIAKLNIQNNAGAPGLRGTVNIRGLAATPQPKSPAVPIPVGYHLVEGKVIDSAGRSMVGATVTMFGVGIAQTDSYGEFSIAVPPKGEFYISFVGYADKMVEIDKSPNYLVRIYERKELPNERIIRGISPDFYRKSVESANINIKKAVIPPSIPVDTTCHENIKFRDRFFGSISLIEKRTFQKDNSLPVTISNKQYYKALGFLARYVDLNISADKRDNQEYKSYFFYNDAQQWHRWYTANKCNNLK